MLLIDYFSHKLDVALRDGQEKGSSADNLHNFHISHEQVVRNSVLR